MPRPTRTGLRGWLDRHPETYPALRKALRATVTACIGFFGCRYGLGDTVMATYALFSAIAVGALSDVFGPPGVRTRVYLGALPVAALLVTLGTLAAAHLWTAVLGVLVVGFAVAYAGVGGPRVVGLANGMQLFYILPCFPPYAPDTLDARLIGLAIGIALVTVADRVLLPEPAPGAFATRVADSADLVVTYLDAIREHPGVPHYELRALTRQALEQLRLTAVPLNERPIGPGRRDRGLMHAAGSIRIIGARASVLDELPCTPDAPPVALIIELLDTVCDLLNRTSAALRGLGPPPTTGALDRVIGEYLRRRADWVAQRGEQTEPPEGLRAAVAAMAVAEATRGIVAATRAATGESWPREDPVPLTAWYLNASALRLWGERLLSNLTPHSVYLQNAVRLALGLAVARAAVDVLHLSHGLWVLLATLTLMRTTLVASGTALLPALGGTLIGAVLGAALLTAVGGHDVVYAVLLPVVMLVSFTAGTVLGPVYGQAGFTLVVSAAFAQLAPATWTLAGARLLDVVTGGLIGTVIGAAVWPRGGAGELRRIAERSLRVGADDMVATVDVLSGVARSSGRVPAAKRSRASRLTVLFEHAYSQYRTEPGRTGQRDDDADWLVVLAIMRRMAGEAELLIGRHPDSDPLPWPSVGPHLDQAAQEVAQGYRHVADAIAHGRASDCGATALHARLVADPPTARYAADPGAALRALDAWGWLHVLAHDLDRVERAVQPLPVDTPRTAAPTPSA
ncbi:MAG TPA: FUSC family protein [Pseudonocardia sp.]|nr:FUSC family protein [Pseudonocardia sp.]